MKKKEKEEVILIMHRLNIWNKTPGGRKPRLYPHRFFFFFFFWLFSFLLHHHHHHHLATGVRTYKAIERKREIVLCLCIYVARLWGGNEALLLCTR